MKIIRDSKEFELTREELAAAHAEFERNTLKTMAEEVFMEASRYSYFAASEEGQQQFQMDYGCLPDQMLDRYSAHYIIDEIVETADIQPVVHTDTLRKLDDAAKQILLKRARTLDPTAGYQVNDLFRHTYLLPREMQKRVFSAEGRKQLMAIYGNSNALYRGWDENSNLFLVAFSPALGMIVRTFSSKLSLCGVVRYDVDGKPAPRSPKHFWANKPVTKEDRNPDVTVLTPTAFHPLREKIQGARKKLPYPENFFAEVFDADPDSITQDAKDALAWAVKNCPESHRRAIELYFREKASLKVCAEQMGCTVSAFNALMQDIRTTFVYTDICNAIYGGLDVYRASFPALGTAGAVRRWEKRTKLVSWLQEKNFSFFACEIRKLGLAFETLTVLYRAGIMLVLKLLSVYNGGFLADLEGMTPEIMADIEDAIAFVKANAD